VHVVRHLFRAGQISVGLLEPVARTAAGISLTPSITRPASASAICRSRLTSRCA